MDPDRTLTPRGVDQAKVLKRFRKAAGIKWDIAFSSDFDRAVDTRDYVANRSAQPIMLKSLRPTGTAEQAYTDMRGRFEIGDDTHVLVVTHDPLINKMAAAVCSGFSPDINNFGHGAMLRVDTHPTEKHPLRWMITPDLVESLEEGELIEAISNLRESLNQSAKARVVDPLIRRLKLSLAKRFRAQARDYKFDGKIYLHPTNFDAVMARAHHAGAAMTWAQIGRIEEAKKDKPSIPPWLVAMLPFYGRGEDDLEREIDETSAERIASAVAAGDDQQTIAKMIASWAQDRAQTIAEYEVSRSYHSGAGAAAGLIAQQQGVEVEKAWDVDADPCEICEGNLNDGWIPEDILFASGDDAPPQHPNCRCSLSYRTVGGDE